MWDPKVQNLKLQDINLILPSLTTLRPSWADFTEASIRSKCSQGPVWWGYRKSRPISRDFFLMNRPLRLITQCRISRNFFFFSEILLKIRGCGLYSGASYRPTFTVHRKYFLYSTSSKKLWQVQVPNEMFSSKISSEESIQISTLTIKRKEKPCSFPIIEFAAHPTWTTTFRV